MGIHHIYKFPGLNADFKSRIIRQLKTKLNVKNVDTECCYNIESSARLSTDDMNKLLWIMKDSWLETNGGGDSSVGVASFLNPLCSKMDIVVEIGPRLNFSTPFCTNAVSIFKAMGLNHICRIECSIRYLVQFNDEHLDKFKEYARSFIVKTLCDRMTEYEIKEPIVTFEHGINPTPWHEVDVLNKGIKALEEINEEMGLSMDENDMIKYVDFFTNIRGRNPTNVECFDLAQSYSEHSRHLFFNGILTIDGVKKALTLMDMIKETQSSSNPNNVTSFCDNSSAISGYRVIKLHQEITHASSKYVVTSRRRHLIFTAETHNFPTAVSPFSGAATGTGGRIRDIQAIGCGGCPIAGTMGYSVGNLFIPGYVLPWEDKSFTYPSAFAKPLDILIEASNGASDYGNKFGEPVIAGFTRSFAHMNDQNERREYVKPILFTGGIGTVESRHSYKNEPLPGMKVVKIGGPVYRIGVGGGSASSAKVQGDNRDELDFNAVQRGDPEMEQKLNRFIRACIDRKMNPILSIHDQGAGGNGNVLKELVYPNGAVIFAKSFKLGDPSINMLELWGAEYQESNAILCAVSDIPLLNEISLRERCPMDVVGYVNDSKRIILTEREEVKGEFVTSPTVDKPSKNPVDLNLIVLQQMPKKEFSLWSGTVILKNLELPLNLKIGEALNRILRHPTVCSKKFLTNKVDRSVSGLVAQQQCVGPLQLPLADVAVTAISCFEKCGIASSIGEQPIKGLINPSAGARMTVAEAVTNLCSAVITNLKDAKCSGNWMWPAKFPGEGAALYDMCSSMCTVLKILGIAVDGGKDSLSMAAHLGNSDIVKSPGTLVLSAYAPCPNIMYVVTPDLKIPRLHKIKGTLLHVDISCGQFRLGGSILAQCYKQLGNSVPDLDKPVLLKDAFEVMQQLVRNRAVISLHDISDGGLIGCVVEMSLGGICGVDLDFTSDWYKAHPAMNVLFSEECGWVLECFEAQADEIIKKFDMRRIKCTRIGNSTTVGMNSLVRIKCAEMEFSNKVHDMLLAWEETSYKIECLQMNPDCAKEEYDSYKDRSGLNFVYSLAIYPPLVHFVTKFVIPVAIIREEGINGDLEMANALYLAGFQVWDVTMQDLLSKKITLDRFRGIIFPGGFSYADVFGSAKGWAANLRFNEDLQTQFTHFYRRPNTFSFGVCNGCQLMCLMGWMDDRTDRIVPRLMPNNSGRFESRFSAVRIYESSAIMLKHMQNSVLGVWVAHGEGRFAIDGDINVIEKSLRFPIRYVDDMNNPSEKYPSNPNGSPFGIAAVCSADGRHLAMMPHPERCIKFWQWPYVPPKWYNAVQRSTVNNSPWFRMFLNAYLWCHHNNCNR